jgi:hypothetical protein
VDTDFSPLSLSPPYLRLYIYFYLYRTNLRYKTSVFPTARLDSSTLPLSRFGDLLTYLPTHLTTHLITYLLPTHAHIHTQWHPSRRHWLLI